MGSSCHILRQGLSKAGVAENADSRFKIFSTHWPFHSNFWTRTWAKDWLSAAEGLCKVCALFHSHTTSTLQCYSCVTQVTRTGRPKGVSIYTTLQKMPSNTLRNLSAYLSYLIVFTDLYEFLIGNDPLKTFLQYLLDYEFINSRTQRHIV